MAHSGNVVKVKDEGMRGRGERFERFVQSIGHRVNSDEVKLSRSDDQTLVSQYPL